MSLNLLPQPREIHEVNGQQFVLPEISTIALQTPRPAQLLSTARRLQSSLADYAKCHYEIAGGTVDATIRLQLGPSTAQGYHLSITDDGVVITGHDEAGLFYGACTLIQLLRTHGNSLPQVQITDAPDFPERGVMLDVSRDKVPTMETLYELIDLLAGWKINQVQLYTEHTFAYSQHKIVWENASPITAEEILLLDAYCKERYIDLVPNQNSFGHMHRWFKHDPYLHMAETEHETISPWGTTLPPFSLSPAVPGSVELVKEMLDELLPNFTSPYVNVGCDETFDLGKGKSAAWVETKGKGRVYYDFLMQIYGIVRSHDRKMQFWGDIINQHPDLVPALPRDAVALEWGYEANHDFPGKSKLFAESGLQFYVCPGTSSWNAIAGRTDNAVGNLRSAADSGLKYGAIGYLNTDWGDRGHWQMLPVSYLGFAYGAALSWCRDANADLDIPAALDTHCFYDEAGIMGKLAYELGNIYKQPGVMMHNSSILFWTMMDNWHDVQNGLASRIAHDEGKAILQDPELFHAKLEETQAQLTDIMAPLNESQMGRADADLIVREFRQAAQMLQFSIRHTIYQMDHGVGDKTQLADELKSMIAGHRDLWLARNRSGGLSDSVGRFNTAQAVYTGDDT